MDLTIIPSFAALTGGGVIAGLALLFRGMGGYSTSARIGDTATSTITSLAAGEVRVTGIVEPAEVTLVSLLQSTTCVHYRATVETDDRSSVGSGGLTEERAVGFRVRDASGSIRIFPRGGRFDDPLRFDGDTGSFGDEPIGLAIRVGAAFQGAEDDQIAAQELLQVRVAGGSGAALFSGRTGRRRYREHRLEPGDAVTIIGRALPFGDLDDPTEADMGTDDVSLGGDAEIAADLAEARAAGLLKTDPEDAWGNAAIPGFGIGRPVRAPELDPADTPLPLATAEEAARATRTFEIAPETLVLAASPEVPLLIAFGTPSAAAGRERGRFLVGLLGAVLAVGSAMGFAIMLNGGFGS